MQTISGRDRTFFSFTGPSINLLKGGGFNKLATFVAFIIAFTSLEISAQSQVFISEKWSGIGGITAMYHHNVSKTDDQQNVYVAGSTINSSGNHDIILQKFDRDGELLWQQTHNGLAELDDMAADLFIDDQYNVYVTGTSIENIQSGYDLCVLKYNSQGTLQWKYSYDNGAFPLPYDAGTAITGDNDGSIFVTGVSMADTTMSDFVTIRLNTSFGNEVWKKRYDYTALNDIAAKIAVKDGQVVVSGASQSGTSPEKWELATLTYAVSNGNLLNERRTSGSATDGVDEIYDITVDDDYIYVAGAVQNTTTGYDIRIYKLDDELNIVWEEDFDGYEGTDKAHGIKVDTDGNVYVAGYVTHPTQGRNYITLKYDSNGLLKWNREFNGQANANDEAVQMVIDDQDRIFVTGKLRNNDYTDYVTVGYYSNGDIFGQAIFYSPSGLNDEPAAITIDLDGNLIVTGQCEQPGGTMRTYTVKYKVYDKPFDPVVIDSVPSHNANELLIRFDRSVMNYAAVNNRAFTAGALSDFVKQQVIDSMNAKVPGVDFKKLEAYKVFQRMTTADTLSITRLGDTIKVKDFWATLSVLIPNGSLDEQIDSLKTIFPYLKNVQKNYAGQLAQSADDPLYNSGSQGGLNNEQYGINIEPAWEIQVGQDYTKVGVYDSGINWRHFDFGGPLQQNSKIAGGMHWSGLDIWNLDEPDFMGHGTAIAGIIGAVKNKFLIAGIAGGNMTDQNSGCSLYDFNIPWYIGWYPQEIPNVFNSYVIPFIVEGAMSSANSDYGFGLHIQNHSWTTPPIINVYVPLLEDAIRTCFNNQCAIVACSGNEYGDIPFYPASYFDEWVMKVGASNLNGEHADFSTYGNNMDFVAPGETEIPEIPYLFLHNVENDEVHDPVTLINEPWSKSVSGTSYSAAHVSGLVALMHSEHNILNPEHNYPNDLAPDDFEKLIEKNTFESLNNQEYNEYVGFGRINAGATLNDMSLPESYVLHSGDDPASVNISQSTTSLLVSESLETLPPTPTGSYSAEKYEVNQTFIETLPLTHALIDHWPRFSSSIGMSDNNIVPEETYFEYNVDVEGNTVTVHTTTYTWKISVPVFDGSGGVNYIDTWHPRSPDNLKTTFSLHIKDLDLVTAVDETLQKNLLKIFPNPNGGESLYVEFDSIEENVVSTLTVFDTMGSEIFSTNLNGMHSHILNLPPLTPGLYLVSLNHGDNVYSEKLIIK